MSRNRFLLEGTATDTDSCEAENDWGLPGRITAIEEMPTLDQLIAGYQQLINRAEKAGITVLLATITPRASSLTTQPPTTPTPTSSAPNTSPKP